MKVGDLVELSAKGKALAYCERFKNRLGIVVAVHDTTRGWIYPIMVQWFNSQAASHTRNSLKYISRA